MYIPYMYMAYLVAEEPVLFLHTLLVIFSDFWNKTRRLGEGCLFQLHVRMMMRMRMMMIILSHALVLLLSPPPYLR